MTEKEARTFIEETLGESVSGSLDAELKSGVILCKLINKIKPGAVAKISTSKMPFAQMENVNAYISACKTMGVPDQYNFVTVDLFEAKNMGQVYLNLVTLKRQAGLGYDKSGGLSTSSGTAATTPSKSPRVQQDLNKAKDDSVEGTGAAKAKPAAEQKIDTGDGIKRTGSAYRAGQEELTSAKTCCVCSGPITSGCINAVNQYWHTKCFNCKKCGVKNLANSKYYEHANKPYCEKCIYQVNPGKNTVKTATADLGFSF